MPWTFRYLLGLYVPFCTYLQGLLVSPRIHGIYKDSWYLPGLMVLTKTHGIYNTHGIYLDSWYRIGNPDSHPDGGPSVTRMRDFLCQFKNFSRVFHRLL